MTTRLPAGAMAALAGLAGSRTAVLAVLALGAALRLWALQHARFDFDEAQSWRIALHIAGGQSFPTMGGMMSGSEASSPGPLFYYVIALSQLFSADPRAGSALLAALSLLALWLVFRAVRDGGQPEAAALWLLVAVFSPWTVVYGDRIWTANLLLPAGGAAVFAIARVVQREGSRTAALLGFVLLAALQVHPAALHLWTLALAAWLVFRPRINMRWLAAGVLAGALTYVPYLAHELASGFSNTRLVLGQSAGRPRGTGSLPSLLLHYVGFATTDVSYLAVRGFYGGFDHLDFWMQDGPGRTQAYYAEAAPLLWPVQAAGWALAAWGLVLTARRLASAATRSLWDVLFAAGAVSVALLHLISGRGGFAHYAIVLAPLSPWPVVLALLAQLRGRCWWIGVLYVLALAPAGWLSLRPYYRVDSRQSVAQQNRVITFVLQRTGDRQPFELVLALREGRPSTYGLLAREYHRAVWPVATRAANVFTVAPADQPTPAVAPGRVAATATLGALTVIHSLREGP